MTTFVITQAQLDLFKSHFPNDPNIQALTLAEVQANTAGKTVDWNNLVLNPQPELAVSRVAYFHLTTCDIAIAKVIVDVVMFAIGATGLASKLPDEVYERVAVAAEEGLVEIEQIVKEMGEADGFTAKAKLAFNILGKINDIGCLGAVIGAIFKSLSWWDMILYGIIAIGTIVALVASDGVSFAIELGILMANGVFLVEDTVHCISTCSGTPTPAATGYGIQTVNGHFWTVVNGGAVGDKVAAFNTEDSWVTPDAKFTVVPIDPATGTFALRCPDGLYVTAINGGGIGGPNNHESPVHTDARYIGKYETIAFEAQPDGTTAIKSCYGYYITAVNGGGWPEEKGKPFRTNTVEIGPWETFKLILPGQD